MMTNLLSRAWVYPLLFCSVLGTSCSGSQDSSSAKSGEKQPAREQLAPREGSSSDPQAQPRVAQSTVIGAGARRLAPGDFGWTELMDAAAKGDLAGVRDLLAKGADVNARDESGRTALMSAANAAVAEALIAKGADVNAKAQNGMTAWTYALTRHIDVAQILLAQGADPNAKGITGSQVLQDAALRGQASMVRA